MCCNQERNGQNSGCGCSLSRAIARSIDNLFGSPNGCSRNGNTRNGCNGCSGTVVLSNGNGCGSCNGTVVLNNGNGCGSCSGTVVLSNGNGCGGCNGTVVLSNGSGSLDFYYLQQYGLLRTNGSRSSCGCCS